MNENEKKALVPHQDASSIEKPITPLTKAPIRLSQSMPTPARSPDRSPMKGEKKSSTLADKRKKTQELPEDVAALLAKVRRRSFQTIELKRPSDDEVPKEEATVEARIVIQGMSVSEMLVGLLTDPDQIDSQKNQARLHLLDKIIAGNLWNIRTVGELSETIQSLISAGISGFPIIKTASEYTNIIATVSQYISSNPNIAYLPLEKLDAKQFSNANDTAKLLQNLQELAELVDIIHKNISIKTQYYETHMFLMPQFRCGSLEVPIEDALGFCQAHVGLVPFESDAEKEMFHRLQQSLSNATPVERISQTCEPVRMSEATRTSSARLPLPTSILQGGMHGSPSWLNDEDDALKLHNYGWLASHPDQELVAALYDLYRISFKESFSLDLPIVMGKTQKIDVSSWIPNGPQKTADHLLSARSGNSITMRPIEERLRQFKEANADIVRFNHTTQIGLLLESVHAAYLKQNAEGNAVDLEHPFSTYVAWLKDAFVWNPEFNFGLPDDAVLSVNERRGSNTPDILVRGFGERDLSRYADSGNTPYFRIDELLEGLIYKEDEIEWQYASSDEHFSTSVWQLQRGFSTSDDINSKSLPSEKLIKWLQKRNLISSKEIGWWRLAPNAPQYVSLDQVCELLDIDMSLKVALFTLLTGSGRVVPFSVDFEQAQQTALEEWLAEVSEQGNTSKYENVTRFLSRFGLLVPPDLLDHSGVSENDALTSQQFVIAPDGVHSTHLLRIPFSSQTLSLTERINTIMRELRLPSRSLRLPYDIRWDNPSSLEVILSSIEEYELTKRLDAEIYPIYKRSHDQMDAETSEKLRSLQAERAALVAEYQRLEKVLSPGQWNDSYREKQAKLEQLKASPEFKKAQEFCRTHAHSRYVAEHDQILFTGWIRTALVSLLMHIMASTTDADISAELTAEEVERFSLESPDILHEPRATIRSRAVIKIQAQLHALDELLSDEKNAFALNPRRVVPQLPELFSDVQSILGEVHNAVKEWEDATIVEKKGPIESVYAKQPTPNTAGHTTQQEIVPSEETSESFGNIEDGSVLTQQQIKELRQGYEQKKNDDVADTLYHIKRIMSEQGMQPKNPSTKDISSLLREIAEQRGIQVKKASFLSRVKASLKKMWGFQ